MTTLPDFDSVVRAVDLWSAPHVPQVLACLQQGAQPWDALPNADAALVEAAVLRLIDIGAVREVAAASVDSSSSRYDLALTTKGRQVARIVEELAEQERHELEPAAGLPATRHEQMTDQSSQSTRQLPQSNIIAAGVIHRPRQRP